MFISKVFAFTNIPIDTTQHSNVTIGGTGFFFDKAPALPYEIEHHMPDYHLYDKYVESQIALGSKTNLEYYTDYSIGFTTRGCFRKCSFCVNKNYDKVECHAPVSEFWDQSRKHICLLDDNILGYHDWRKIIESLVDTGKYFRYKQGMDIRLMTEEKAKVLSSVKYRGDYIFAFDHIKDRELIERKLRLWKHYTNKTTKLYVLVAYESQDVQDVINTFERIRILMKCGCLPYIMRYESYKDSPMYGMYTNLAAWCNQPNFFKKMTFREFCIERGKSTTGNKGASWRYMEEFEKVYPDVAKKYFDMRYEEIKEV